VGNVVDSNTISGNRIAIVVRPADPSPVVRLTRNRISDNAKDIHRCEAGGSCDPASPKGAIAMGLPGLEHENFIGSRGRGVAANPATMQHICPDHAPQCQTPPNRGLVAPTVTTAIAAKELTISGKLTGIPSTRYVVELFGNAAADGHEAEIFLGDSAVYTDPTGAATFVIKIDRARDDRVRSVTATITSDEGATSALSDAVPVKELASR
jgi:3-dehydroshikimate dehydratase